MQRLERRLQEETAAKEAALADSTSSKQQLSDMQWKNQQLEGELAAEKAKLSKCTCGAPPTIPGTGIKPPTAQEVLTCMACCNMLHDRYPAPALDGSGSRSCSPVSCFNCVFVAAACSWQPWARLPTHCINVQLEALLLTFARKEASLKGHYMEKAEYENHIQDCLDSTLPGAHEQTITKYKQLLLDVGNIINDRKAKIKETQEKINKLEADGKACLSSLRHAHLLFYVTLAISLLMPWFVWHVSQHQASDFGAVQLWLDTKMLSV